MGKGGQDIADKENYCTQGQEGNKGGIAEGPPGPFPQVMFLFVVLGHPGQYFSQDSPRFPCRHHMDQGGREQLGLFLHGL